MSSERNLMSKRGNLENKITTLTGGRVAEELIFGIRLRPAHRNDIEQATKLARAMITRYGMADEVRHGGA